MTTAELIAIDSMTRADLEAWIRTLRAIYALPETRG
jgi:hypothetical protein